MENDENGSDTGSQQEDGSPSNKKTVQQSMDKIHAAELSKAKLELTELRRTTLPRLRGLSAYEKRRYGKSFVDTLQAVSDARSRMNYLQEIISGLTPVAEPKPSKPACSWCNDTGYGDHPCVHPYPCVHCTDSKLGMCFTSAWYQGGEEE